MEDNVAHDVFISYSIKDRLLADALCHKLEEDQIRCWIAPRDISPGGSWAGEIADAIPHSKIMILVFSANANASKQVLREVELAITNNLTVIPMKIEDVIPTGGMSYYLSTTHWIDAIGKKFDKRIITLSQKIQAMLGIDKDTEKKEESLINKTNSKTEITNMKPLSKEKAAKPKPPQKTSDKKRNKKKLWIIVPFAILIIGTLSIWGLTELFPDFNLLSKATATPPPTHWNTIPARTANPPDFEDDIIPLKDSFVYSPEDFGYHMEKGVNIEDEALRNAIIENLNSTREIQINDGNLTIGDMFDLRYLNLVSPDEDGGLPGMGVLSDPEDLALENIVISYPKSINSLNGLQYAKNLLVLNIWGYPIDDLSAISSLESLRSLFLKTGQWIDPEAFGNLGSLYYLEIQGLINQEHFNAVSWLTKLQNLSISFFSYDNFGVEGFGSESGNPITDLSPLTRLDYLYVLTLDGLGLKDISPVENITTLVHLNMSANLISDITPIGNLSNLEFLWLYNNLITDVSPLKNLRNLIDLNLEMNNIYNIEEIIVLDNLQELYIDAATYISKKDELNELKYKGCVVYATKQPPEFYGYDPEDIVNIGNNEIEQGIRNNLAMIDAEPDENITIADMFNLESLIFIHHDEEFDENLLGFCDDRVINFGTIIGIDESFDLDFLEYARNLKVLYLSNYEISDISVVESLENLQLIGMPNNNISDLAPLANLHNLRAVEFPYNLITDFGPLVDKLPNLQSINLGSNLIEDLTPFEDAFFPDLYNIGLWSNNISDVSSLSALTNLKELEIMSNDINDLSPLLKITELKHLGIDEAMSSRSPSVIQELRDRGCEVIIN